MLFDTPLSKPDKIIFLNSLIKKGNCKKALNSGIVRLSVSLFIIASFIEDVDVAISVLMSCVRSTDVVSNMITSGAVYVRFAELTL